MRCSGIDRHAHVEALGNPRKLAADIAVPEDGDAVVFEFLRWILGEVLTCVEITVDSTAMSAPTGRSGVTFRSALKAICAVARLLIPGVFISGASPPSHCRHPRRRNFALNGMKVAAAMTAWYWPSPASARNSSAVLRCS